MNIPAGDIETIQSAVRRLLADAEKQADSTAKRPDGEDKRRELALAFDQLFDVMTRIEADHSAAGDARPPHGATGEDVSTLGEYAIELYQGLTTSIQQPAGQVQREMLAGLVIDIVLWVARYNGRIDTLEPVVDALALAANSTQDTKQLEKLSDVMRLITEAISLSISQDIDKANPGRPWRVLLLNRGIVATRSYNTDIMEDAFRMLTTHLPEDAAHFFSEGMQQMDALNYPPHVRKVMDKYHRQWTNRSLH